MHDFGRATHFRWAISCGISSFFGDRRFHIGFVPAALVYQISFILRLFDTIV